MVFRYRRPAAADLVNPFDTRCHGQSVFGGSDLILSVEIGCETHVSSAIEEGAVVDAPVIETAIRDIDSRISEQINLILHHKQFQQWVPGPQFRSNWHSLSAVDQTGIQVLIPPEEHLVFKSLSNALALNVRDCVRALLECKSQTLRALPPSLAS